MAQTTISFRIDEDLKTNLESICNELGINMTTAFIIFAKKMNREKRIPFDVCIDPFYSELNQKRLAKAISELEDGKGSIHELIEVNDD